VSHEEGRKTDYLFKKAAENLFPRIFGIFEENSRIKEYKGKNHVKPLPVPNPRASTSSAEIAWDSEHVFAAAGGCGALFGLPTSGRSGQAPGK
jgi:hypothetical protein